MRQIKGIKECKEKRDCVRMSWGDAEGGKEGTPAWREGRKKTAEFANGRRELR
ncbi:MAG: hypothetical protein V4719_09260 [Planctomycetota bacterium]